MLTPFTEFEWDEFAGAENLPDGSDPLFRGITDQAHLVVCGNGFGAITIEVDLLDPQSFDCRMYTQDFESINLAKLVAENLTPEHMSETALLGLGFCKI
jgi:hypothetical protein